MRECEMVEERNVDNASIPLWSKQQLQDKLITKDGYNEMIDYSSKIKLKVVKLGDKMRRGRRGLRMNKEGGWNERFNSLWFDLIIPSQIQWPIFNTQKS